MVQKEGSEKQHDINWAGNRLRQPQEVLGEHVRSWCQKTAVTLQNPGGLAGQVMLFAMGMMVLTVGLGESANAARHINYNADRLNDGTNALLLYLEGSFGALVMVSSGIGAILSSAFGQYRAALGLMVVAIGSFILRSLMSTFFNDAGIAE